MTKYDQYLKLLPELPVIIPASALFAVFVIPRYI